MNINEKNIKAILQHGNDTRLMVRKAEEEMKLVRNENQTLLTKIETMESQIQMLQVKLYSGGSTSGDHG